MTKTYRLLGITTTRSACDCCGRKLARVFRVADATGTERLMGRVCAAKATGYNWTVAQAERAERFAQQDAAAAARWPDLHAALVVAQRECATRSGQGGAAGEGLGMLRSRAPWQSEQDAEDFARRCLAAAT